MSAVALTAATVATSTFAARSTVEESTAAVSPSIGPGPAPGPEAFPGRRPVESTRFRPVVPQQAEGTVTVASAEGGSSGPAA